MFAAISSSRHYPPLVPVFRWKGIASDKLKCSPRPALSGPVSMEKPVKNNQDGHVLDSFASASPASRHIPAWRLKSQRAISTPRYLGFIAEPHSSPRLVTETALESENKAYICWHCVRSIEDNLIRNIFQSLPNVSFSLAVKKELKISSVDQSGRFSSLHIAVV